MLLAVLPVNIAYSRFGWDTSQTLLATLPAVYLPLLAAKEERSIVSDGWSGRGLVFLASLVVHPDEHLHRAAVGDSAALGQPRRDPRRGAMKRPAWQWIIGGAWSLQRFVGSRCGWPGIGW